MACFRCSLLYEVAETAGVPCPSCGTTLVAHSPDKVFDLEATGSLSGPADAAPAPSPEMEQHVDSTGERTMLLGDLDNALELLKQHSRPSALINDLDSTLPAPTGPVPPRRNNPPAPPKDDSLDIGPTRLFSSTPPPRLRPDSGPVPGFEGAPTRPAPESYPQPPARAAAPKPRPSRPGSKPAAPPAPPASPAQPATGDGDDYFDRSKFVEVPDAIGDLLQARPAPAAPRDDGPPRGNPPRRRRGGISLLGVGVTAVILAGIVAMVIFKPDPNDPGSARSPDPKTPDRPAAEVSELARAVAQAVPSLPTGPHIDPVVEAVWIVAGPEALRTSAGSIPGVASNRPPPSAFRRDDRGSWLPGMRQALGRAVGPARDQLALALDAGTPASSLLRFAYSGHLAGFNRFSVIVQREDKPDKLSAIDFSLDLPDNARPSAGVAVIRVGRLGLRISVESRDGERLTPVDAVVPRSAGAVDEARLEQVLNALSTRHRAIRVAIVHLDPDMTLTQVVPLLVKLREAADRDRFPSLRLAPG